MRLLNANSVQFLCGIVKRNLYTQEQLSIMLNVECEPSCKGLKREAAAARLSCCRIFRPA